MGGPLGWYKSHAGYAELNRYYIQWFKTQQRPTLTQDALFYFYRTHRASAVAAADPLGPVIPVGAAPDEINMTVFARSTGLTLWVNSGGAVSERALPPGLTSLSVPFGEGEQRFELRGPSRTLVATPEPVVGAITRYDFWPTSGWLEGDLGP